MAKKWSALTDDLEHCYATGSSNVAVRHVFPGIQFWSEWSKERDSVDYGVCLEDYFEN